MAYRVDTSYLGWENAPVRHEREATIALVGCGGTGGYLAEGICRLLIGCRADLYLIDPDQVEERNIGRQAFTPRDVGRFKAEVLAERLSERFGREIGYSVLPYDRQLHASVFDRANYQLSRLNLVVGAVDNADARRAIAGTLIGHDLWYLDTGNSYNSGQILVGNASEEHQLEGAFHVEQGLVRTLPAPSLQRPDLLDAPPEPEPRLDCTEAVIREEQSRIINQMMASLAATFIEKLLSGTLTWMGAYVDLDTGALQTVPADPRTVSEMTGMSIGLLEHRRGAT